MLLCFINKEKEELPEDYFDKYEELKDFKIKKIKKKEFLYTLGNSKEKSELIKIFDIVLKLGFEDAEIISNYDITE